MATVPRNARRTGLIAVLAATFQALWLPDPASHISSYLSIWICTAVLSAALTGVQMYTRTRRIHSGMSQEMMHTAVEQFLPSVAAGLLTTIVLVRYVPAALWMLPGIWQVISAWACFRRVVFYPGRCWQRACGTCSRADLYRTRRRPGALPMGDGYSLWNRTTAGRRNSALWHARG